MAPESFPPRDETPRDESSEESLAGESAGDTSEREQLAWDAIVADLSGQIDIGDLVQAPDAFIDELLAEEPDYQPPHPPPLKAPADAVARFAWAGALGGPVFVFLAYALDWGTWLGAAGVIASIAGFGTLVARMPHERDSDDDGAVV